MSVLAKLISIVYEIDFYFIEDGNFDAFSKLLKKYCIDFPFSDSTQIEISFALAHWIITKERFRVVKSFGNGDVPKNAEIITNVYDKNASIYVPAERNLMSVFTNNIFFLKIGFQYS